MQNSVLLVRDTSLFSSCLSHLPAQCYSATATYRLLPHIKILSPIPLAHVEKFQKCFAPGVIHVDPRTKDVSVDPVAVRKDWVTREVLRHPEFEGKVQLGRVRDHFLCEYSLF